MEREFHVGESAELYAAGALDAREQAEVEAHVAECADCLRRLGEAEETVLALERVDVAESTRPVARVLPSRTRSVPAWWIAAAAAAAFIIGFLAPHAAPRPGVAMVALIHSHFSHAQFAGTGPAAKVIYAHDRSWYYVLVAGTFRYEVYGLRAGRAVDLGTTTPQGPTSELFARVAANFDRLELRENGTTIESAAIR
jgi:hypothetical protein